MEFFSDFDTKKIIIFVISAIVIIFYVIRKWRRASAYVDQRGAEYDESLKYSERVKQDSRWQRFRDEMTKMVTIEDTQSNNADAYQIFRLHIQDTADPQQRLFEPNSPGSENATFIAYLKRKSKPKYLQIAMAPNGEMFKREIGALQWNAMFEGP
ncbi:MAG: hypothetical protein JXX14_06670 [Deltaproteobacteria bacterium]|nr:hypothetical protein [Deltaproteobacteria bacterium]